MCSSLWTRLLLATLLLGLALPAAAPAAAAPPAGGKVFLTTKEALKLAFPKCEVKRGTAYLTETHKKRVAKLAKIEFESGVVYPYTATKDGKVVGTAYFDTHRVRTLRETIMVVVKPDGSIGRVELLSFGEPRDYIPRGNWYGQFPGKKLGKDLSLKREIKGVTGATLTAKATVSCARRVLALHQVLEEIEREKLQKKNGKKQGTTERKGGAT
jgi:hypothetical protein